MNINELTLGDIEKIKSLFSGSSCTTDDHPYRVGEKYLIRTVTHYYAGQLKAIYKHEIVLSDASWIADTGRFYDALSNGGLDEVEPIPGDLIVGRGGIIDCAVWAHELPKEQK